MCKKKKKNKYKTLLKNLSLVGKITEFFETRTVADTRETFRFFNHIYFDTVVGETLRVVLS